MDTLKAQTIEHSKPQLGKADWIKTALNFLVNDGIDAVQITKIAKSLDVSRGSFYWHFTDRKHLIDEVLDTWRSNNFPVISQVLSQAASLSEGVLSFFAIWEEREQFNPQLDQAVRDWARLDLNILKIVRTEDDHRIKVISQFFVRFGFAEDEANVRARILYFAQVGYYAMNVGDNIEERLSMLEQYFFCFTGQNLDKYAAIEFQKRMGPKL